MRIEATWKELEAELAPGLSGGWVSRYALPDPHNNLLVAVDLSTKKRALLLPVSGGALPPRPSWPQCNGLELFTVQINGKSHLGVRLSDETYRDVFSALAEDVAPRLTESTEEHYMVRTLLDRLRRWQKFLAARNQSLSVGRQRGLFGELHLIRHILGPAIGIESSVSAWRAPLASHQDFQFTNAAIEVKTTTAKQPQDVRITSERQLDSTGTPALFLFVCVLDEREIDPSGATEGESLPECVNAIRKILGIEGVLRETFDDRLLDAGYLDADAPELEMRRFTPRSHQCFRVRTGFPRLTEADLPNGVGDVSYDLSLAACAPFSVPVAEMISASNVAATVERV